MVPQFRHEADRPGLFAAAVPGSEIHLPVRLPLRLREQEPDRIGLHGAGDDLVLPRTGLLPRFDHFVWTKLREGEKSRTFRVQGLKSWPLLVELSSMSAPLCM